MGPRVLIDATAVPADRGGVGRYIEGLVPALDRAGAGIAVACQRADADRLPRIAPTARILSAPTTVSHRQERLAWEQTGPASAGPRDRRPGHPLPAVLDALR